MEADDGPPTAKRARVASDRVTLNCAGTLFYTTTATLRLTSSYFASMLNDRWEESKPDEIFLDRDADAFKVLLSCMRNHTVLLPQSDADLFARVMLEANFFGVDWLVREVKAKAVQNSRAEKHSDRFRDFDSNYEHTMLCHEIAEAVEENREAVLLKAEEYFDKRFGGLTKALQDGLLPDRYFTEEKKAERAPTIKHLVPAPPDTVVAFSRPVDMNEFMGNEGPHDYEVIEACVAVALATCVPAQGGVEYVEPLISPRGNAFVNPAPEWWETHPRNVPEGAANRGFFDEPDEQLMLASEFIKRRGDWNHPVIWGMGTRKAADEWVQEGNEQADAEAEEALAAAGIEAGGEEAGGE